MHGTLYDPKTVQSGPGAAQGPKEEVRGTDRGGTGDEAALVNDRNVGRPLPLRMWKARHASPGRDTTSRRVASWPRELGSRCFLRYRCFYNQNMGRSTTDPRRFHRVFVGHLNVASQLSFLLVPLRFAPRPSLTTQQNERERMDDTVSSAWAEQKSIDVGPSLGGSGHGGVGFG